RSAANAASFSGRVPNTINQTQTAPMSVDFDAPLGRSPQKRILAWGFSARPAQRSIPGARASKSVRWKGSVQSPQRRTLPDTSICKSARKAVGSLAYLSSCCCVSFMFSVSVSCRCNYTPVQLCLLLSVQAQTFNGFVADSLGFHNLGAATAYVCRG